MEEDDRREPEDKGASFAEQAEGESPGIVAEFLEFLRESKKWWLTPILVLLLLLGALIALSLSGAASFIYPLF
jgi:hypothetical protein